MRSSYALPALIAAASLVRAVNVGQPQPPFNLLITNARIIDGTGAPSTSGSVAVRGGRIAGVGSVGVRRARYWVIWYVVIAGGWISVSRAEATRSDAVPAGTGE